MTFFVDNFVLVTYPLMPSRAASARNFSLSIEIFISPSSLRYLLYPRLLMLDFVNFPLWMRFCSLSKPFSRLCMSLFARLALIETINRVPSACFIDAACSSCSLNDSIFSFKLSFEFFTLAPKIYNHLLPMIYSCLPVIIRHRQQWQVCLTNISFRYSVKQEWMCALQKYFLEKFHNLLDCRILLSINPKIFADIDVSRPSNGSKFQIPLCINEITRIC